MNWIEGIVESNQLLGQKFRLLRLKVPGDFTFKAGQYVIFKIQEDKLNSYSICSLPGGETFEVLVDVSPVSQLPPAGEGSRYIDRLMVGDKVVFAGPFGKFTLQSDEAEVSLFVATGSGISSLMPMVQELLITAKKKVVLFWGFRLRENIIWEEDLEDLKKKYPNFSYEIVLSAANEGWVGKRGHVTEWVSEWLERSNIPTGKVSAYLCGNGAMIREVSERLLSLGVPKGRVCWEKYYEDGGRETVYV